MQGENAVTRSFLVRSLELLNADTYRVQLQCDGGELPVYRAGQYLEILLPGGGVSAFSIASAPAASRTQLELHIQRLDRDSSEQLFSALVSGQVMARLPRGVCHIDRLPEKKLLLIAAGTGFAQAKSIIEQSLALNHAYGISLYWGVKTPSDLYLPELPEQWAVRGVHYHPVISGCKQWHGRCGMLYEAVIEDLDELMDAEVYISGSPAMVYTTIDALVDKGLSLDAMHSDVFEYAPR